MKKITNYTVRQIDKSIEISEATATHLIWRIPYQELSHRVFDDIKNKFIVYILFGEQEEGLDVLYVGKSTNGLKSRPKSHKDKFKNWLYCYVLTQFEERTFFNDGTIQYIEDRVNKRINELNHYVNKTQVTNAGTANRSDMEKCDKYLDKAYEMLNVLGLDLINPSQKRRETLGETDKKEDSTEQNTVIPDGNYYMTSKPKRWGGKVAMGTMQVKGDEYILKAGSIICPHDGPGLIDAICKKRRKAKIKEHILREDLVFKSPSTAAEFLTGGSTNGWLCWKTKDGIPISTFRRN